MAHTEETQTHLEDGLGLVDRRVDIQINDLRLIEADTPKKKPFYSMTLRCVQGKRMISELEVNCTAWQWGEGLAWYAGVWKVLITNKYDTYNIPFGKITTTLSQDDKKKVNRALRALGTFIDRNTALLLVNDAENFCLDQDKVKAWLESLGSCGPKVGG